MTAKQELIEKAWEAARQKNLSKGQNKVNAVEALDWLAEEYMRLLLSMNNKEALT